MSRLSERIDDLFAEEKWKDARALLEKALVKPGAEKDHWLLARLATTYYEQRKYKKALELVEQARALAPRCPLVLWNYSSVLLALGRTAEAIDICLSLLKRGPLAIARDECGEGVEWAVGLLADCLFRVGVGLKLQGEWERAWRFFAGYVEVVDAGAASVYNLLDIYMQISELPPQRDKVVPSGRNRSPRQALEQVSKKVLGLVG